MSEFQQQLVDAIRRDLESIKRRLTYVEGQRDVPYTQVYIAKTGASGIPAMSGSTPGSATVTLYSIDSGGDLTPVTNGAINNPANVTVTAYNIAAGAVAGTAWIQLKQEMVSGKYICDFEDC